MSRSLLMAELARLTKVDAEKEEKRFLGDMARHLSNLGDKYEGSVGATFHFIDDRWLEATLTLKDGSEFLVGHYLPVLLMLGTYEPVPAP